MIKLKTKIKRLRRQMVKLLQDEEIPTGERYGAIVRLYEMEKSMGPIVKKKFCKDLGIGPMVLNFAIDYAGFVEEEPELAKSVSPHIITETKSLPKEEREEIIKEFKDKPDKKRDLIREMVKDKKEEIQTKKELEELDKKSKEIKEAKKYEIKVTTTKEVLEDIRDELFNLHDGMKNLMFKIKRLKKTKFYSYNPKDKQDFFKILDGEIQLINKWRDELQKFRDEFELEIVKE